MSLRRKVEGTISKLLINCEFYFFVECFQMLMMLAMRSLLLERRALTALAREQLACDMIVSISSVESPYDDLTTSDITREGRVI